jgi:hypothetical protein
MSLDWLFLLMCHYFYTCGIVDYTCRMLNHQILYWNDRNTLLFTFFFGYKKQTKTNNILRDSETISLLLLCVLLMFIHHHHHHGTTQKRMNIIVNVSKSLLVPDLQTSKTRTCLFSPLTIKTHWILIPFETH